MQKVQNFVKAAAALLIFFFCYDFLHRDTATHVLTPGGTAVIGDGNVIIHNPNKPSKPTATYVPPEGTITIINSSCTTSGNTAVNPVNGGNTSSNVIIIIKDRGWCKVPGIAVVYSDTALIQLDLKFAFYKRYSATFGMNRQFMNVGIYRHVDDLIKLRNLEVGIVGGLGYDGRTRYGVAARLNL